MSNRIFKFSINFWWNNIFTFFSRDEFCAEKIVDEFFIYFTTFISDKSFIKLTSHLIHHLWNFSYFHSSLIEFFDIKISLQIFTSNSWRSFTCLICEYVCCFDLVIYSIDALSANVCAKYAGNALDLIWCIYISCRKMKRIAVKVLSMNLSADEICWPRSKTTYTHTWVS